MASQVRRNIPSFSTVTSSFKSYINSLPLLTTIIALFCILIYIVDSIQTYADNYLFKLLALEPNAFFNWEVYQLFTFPFPHLSLGHILFCLLAFVPLSTAIEHTIGTLEYCYVLITMFTLLPGAFYLIGSLIFNYKDVRLGGLSTWIFGVVVWESRELAGRERDIFGIIRVPAHFYPLVLLLLMEIFFPRKWFAGHVCGLISGYLYSFGYLSKILPPSGYFVNLESKSIIQRISQIRGFVKAEEGSRGGWWLPLWNDDEVLEDAIHPPGEVLNQIPNTTDAAASTTRTSTIPTTNITTTNTNTSPPPPPISTSTIFVVPSSNSSTKQVTEVNSTNPNIKVPEEQDLLDTRTILSAAVLAEDYRRDTWRKQLQRWTGKWNPSDDDWQRYRIWLMENTLFRHLKRLQDYKVPDETLRLYTFLYHQWNSLSESQKTISGIIAINAVVFLMWQIPILFPFMNRYFSHNPLSGYSITLLTSVFSHKAFWHVGLNMMALYSLGGVVHNLLQREQFLAFYLTSGIFSSLISHIFSLTYIPRAKIIPSIGASGAIFACLSGCAVLYPDASVYVLFFPFFPIKLSYALPMIMGLDLLGILKGWMMFDHYAHLAGAIFGIGYVKYGKEYIWHPIQKYLIT
ncbi:6501_t:CDS:2 [Ambispora gerdemannii]|uniref:6501_t:CDS:1 n=1 Tax=Ambispora gerdemannii TaxID=144530 RepID=A0A9N8W5N2_9GLOM|nr:6501_t:CDS:2 [Ambispora gerdemannii]